MPYNYGVITSILSPDRRPLNRVAQALPGQVTPPTGMAIQRRAAAPWDRIMDSLSHRGFQPFRHVEKLLASAAEAEVAANHPFVEGFRTISGGRVEQPPVLHCGGIEKDVARHQLAG